MFIGIDTHALSHALGAAFDNPQLIVACVIGDGEAETGPLATAWHSHTFLNPARDGAVLPILHLNGYKIANPRLLAHIDPQELDALLRGYGYSPRYVEGAEPGAMHQRMAAVLDENLIRSDRQPGRDVDPGRRRLRHRLADADATAPGHLHSPLAGTPPMLATYLRRHQGEPSAPVKRFIERVI